MTNKTRYDRLIDELIPDGTVILVVPDDVKPTVDQIVADWQHIHEAEDMVKSMHDRVCGRGMYVHENKVAIDDDVYHGIRDDLARNLGQIILDLVVKQ